MQLELNSQKRTVKAGRAVTGIHSQLERAPVNLGKVSPSSKLQESQPSLLPRAGWQPASQLNAELESSVNSSRRLILVYKCQALEVSDSHLLSDLGCM